VDALNAWADIYANKMHPPELEKAEKSYELALAAARVLWPDMEQKPSIEWGPIEHRPFLRACHGPAIIQNNFVPPLLLGDIPLPGRPDYVSAGSMDEVASVVQSSKGSWERVAGILEWFREQQYLGGKKPNGDGSILFQLLRVWSLGTARNHARRRTGKRNSR
jgi:hypothetical protein